MPGCTDTWDEHYAEVSDPSTTLTLWDQISANPKLSKFKALAEKANYYRDEKHPVKDYTFADVLKGSTVTTVWAPENEYFELPAQSGQGTVYDYWMQMCEENGFLAHEQLMSNHIAMFRYQLNADSATRLKTINTKNALFNMTAKTFRDLELGEFNIPAVNGSLHTLKGISPYNYNFYQFIKYAEQTPEITKFVVKRDTVYFNKDASIEGFTNADGKPEYVDSVFRTSNTMFNRSTYWTTKSEELQKWLTPEFGFGAEASLTVEDSTYIMVLPTSQALQQAKEKLLPFYKYATKYSDESTYITTGTPKYNTADDIKVDDPDSVAQQNMMFDIITPTVFNIHKQMGTGGRALTLDEFLNGTEAQYYLNTRGDTIRSLQNWDKKALFENAQKIRMSNGYVFLTDSWSFPASFYKPDVVVELTSRNQLFNAVNLFKETAADFQGVDFNNKTYDRIANKYGKVSKNNFVFIDGITQTGAEMSIPLFTNTNEAYKLNGEVMSGTYDIQVVLVPMWYQEIARLKSDASFVKYDAELDTLIYNEHAMDSIAGKNKVKLKFSLYGNDGKGTTKKLVSDVNWDCKTPINKVDTITIMSNVTFPCTYKNIQNNSTKQIKTYPRLHIVNAAKSTDVKNGYNYDYCIDQIILRSKETQEETGLIP